MTINIFEVCKMKTYEEYEKDYFSGVAKDIKTENVDYNIIKEVWISCKWQDDNNWSPWAMDAEQRLKDLKAIDEKLYNAVMKGISVFFKSI
jgi:hypothetical protein